METVGRIMNNPKGCQSMAHDKSLISQKRTCKFSNLRMLERLGMLENTKKAPESGGFLVLLIFYTTNSYATILIKNIIREIIATN